MKHIKKNTCQYSLKVSNVSDIYILSLIKVSQIIIIISLSFWIFNGLCNITAIFYLHWVLYESFANCLSSPLYILILIKIVIVQCIMEVVAGSFSMLYGTYKYNDVFFFQDGGVSVCAFVCLLSYEYVSWLLCTFFMLAFDGFIRRSFNKKYYEIKCVLFFFFQSWVWFRVIR